MLDYLQFILFPFSIYQLAPKPPTNDDVDMNLKSPTLIVPLIIVSSVDGKMR